MNQRNYKLLFLTLMFMGASTTLFAQVSAESLYEKHERKKNLTIREFNTDAKGNNKWMDHLTVYNDKGYKIEEIEYATFGQRERITFEYDDNDRCIKEVVYDDRNKVCRIRKYMYNADGTKKTQFNYLPNGRLFSTKQFQYTVK